jgi:amino acid adenylation domain-containing protein
MLAAFKVLLHRYTGQDDIVIGTPAAGRSRVELEGLIGFFVNTLVLRTDLSGDPSFKELLIRERDVLLDAHAHQDIPFERLIDELQVKRDLSRNPMFQIMFIQNPPNSPINIPNLKLSNVETHSGTTKFDMSLSTTDIGDRLVGSVEYSSDLYDESTIERLIEHFENLLAAVVAHPEQRLSNLSMMTGESRRRMLIEWNDTATEYPNAEGKGLHHLIEAQVAKTPDATALIYPPGGPGDRKWSELSYSELNRRANRMAHRLRRLGVGPDVLVGICMERSPEMFVGLLGVLKAGGAYVPFDPAYPRERLAFMLSDSDVEVLLTQSRLAGLLPEHAAKVVCLDQDFATLAGESDEGPVTSFAPDGLAYVIYTSGSTGQPKGAMNSHRAICNRLLWMQEVFQLTGADRVLQKTPFSFDVSVWEIFWPLMTGACVVVAEPEGHKDSAYMARVIAEQKITTIHFVPSMLGAFLEEETLEGCECLKQVICSGEALPRAYQERFFARLRARLYNLYGPTEAAIDVTFWPCDQVAQGRTVPIGHPIANTQIYVLDKFFNPVPIGASGELHIGGVGLARGYLNRADLTSEKFIPNPFSEQPGARLYKTGDLARYLPGGSIEFLGRLDDQVKVRGFRIELGEIEAALRQHAALRDAIALVREDSHALEHRQLVAYVMPKLPGESLMGDTIGEQYSSQQVGEWQEVFDRTYSGADQPDEPAFNIAGWDSSYTGQPLPPEEMREWVDRTVERILDLQPKRALEIGCGTGLLLFRIAPRCEQYWGTDLSPAALDYLQAQLMKPEQDLSNVKLFNKAAHDFSGFDETSFDLIILNSVTQYFPNIDYLVEVLKRAAHLINPGGSIFLGDLRSLPLLEAFHASVELDRAGSSLSAAQLERRVQVRISQEQELAVDPAFFFALQQLVPQISQAQINLKRGRYHNELTRFRYDVTLKVRGEARPACDISWLDWQRENLSLATIQQILESDNPEALGITQVPNSRVQSAARILELLASENPPADISHLRQALQETGGQPGIDPEEVWGLGEKLHYGVSINWCRSGAKDCFDAVFTRHAAGAEAARNMLATTDDIERRPWRLLANNPTHVKIARALVPELRSFLKDRLPDYMIPSAFMLVDGWPLTPNGKLDRNALPLPIQQTAEMEENFVAPCTPVQHALASIWSEVLGLERTGITDNFFELGGDSIHSIQVIARARQSGIQLTPRDLFQHQTIEELAAVAHLAESFKAIEPLSSEPLSKSLLAQADREKIDQLLDGEEIEEAYPLSPMQQYMLSRRVRTPEPGLYVVHHAFSLRGGGIDVRAFERAWQQAIDHHTALRTSFLWEGLNEPVQVVHKRAKIHVEQEDLRGLSKSEQDEKFQSCIQSIRRQGFDLSAPPHTRLILLQIAEDAYYLIYAFHLMLQDGWSYSPIMKDVLDCYEAICSGNDPVLHNAYPYKDLIAHVHQQDLSESETYWRKTLEGIAVPAKASVDEATEPTPCDEPVYARESIKLSPSISSALSALASRHHLTLYPFVQAAWALMLNRYSGEKDILFGSIVSGRATDIAGIEQRVGLFFNLLPVRARLDPEASLLNLAQALQAQNVEMRHYQHTPLKKIHEWCGVAEDHHLFESYIVYEHFPMHASLAGRAVKLGLSPVDGLAQTEHPLRVELIHGAGLEIGIAYYRRYFSSGTIKAMLKSLHAVLEGILADPHQRLSALLELIKPEAQAAGRN